MVSLCPLSSVTVDSSSNAGNPPPTVSGIGKYGHVMVDEDNEANSVCSSLFHPSLPGKVDKTVQLKDSAIIEPPPSSTSSPIGRPESCDSINEDQPICRICFGGESSSQLIRACKCSGTIAYAHRECLMRWLLERQDAKCEICQAPYRQTRQLRSWREWRLPQTVCDTSAYRGLLIATLLWICIYYFVMATIPPQSLFVRQAFMYIMYTLMLLLVSLTVIIVKQTCQSMLIAANHWISSNTITTLADSNPLSNSP